MNMDRASPTGYGEPANDGGRVADGSTDFPLPVGDRLRAAREARRMSLEDVATQTRVPLRHLEALERSQWDNLPAPTYSIGFAKAYAEAVGLNRQEIGDELRIEFGGPRATAVAETFQPTDPARVPPRTLAIVAGLIAVSLLAGYGYYRTVALGDVEPQIIDSSGEAVAPAEGSATPAAATGPVVITANQAVWIKVYERSGRSLYENTLAAGQSFEVPATVSDPLLRTGRAELLRVSVGTADAPQVGPANTLIKDVSLKAAMLMTAPTAAAPNTQGRRAEP